MTEQEMINQIEELQAQLVALKAMTRGQKQAKRLAFPKKSKYYREQHVMFDHTTVELLSKLIRNEFFPRHVTLPKMDDAMYAQYSEYFEKIIEIMAEIKKARLLAQTGQAADTSRQKGQGENNTNE